MKRNLLLKNLKELGCVFVKHGKKHDRYINPKTGVTQQIPRHTDIKEILATEILKNLSQYSK
jgi:hypothetical protein